MFKENVFMILVEEQSGRLYLGGFHNHYGDHCHGVG